MKRCLLTLLILLPVMMVRADTENSAWRCRGDVEIQCSDEQCISADPGDFTPMDVSFSSDGELEVCAYSGCWSGKAAVEHAESFMVLTTDDARWVPAQDDGDGISVAIILDVTDLIAVVKAGSFAQPVVCGPE